MLTWTVQQLENANRFTERVAEALSEAGVATDDGFGYVVGWLYGQLRQRYTKGQVRQMFELAIAKCEECLDDVGEV